MKILLAALMVLVLPVMASADVVFGVTVRTAPPPPQIVYVRSTPVYTSPTVVYVPSPPVVYSVVQQPVTVQPLYVPYVQQPYVYTYPTYVYQTYTPAYTTPYVYRPTSDWRVTVPLFVERRR